MHTQNYTKAGMFRNRHLSMPNGLSTGGKLIWARTGFSVSVCNLLATLAGIGVER